MSLRSRLLIALSTTLLGSTAASAGLVTVTSYEMNNGNGATQFTTPTGGQNYFDFTYTKTGEGAPTANASNNGSINPIPYNGVNDAPLTGGTGKLTDGVKASDNYSLVSSPNGTISNSVASGYSFLNGLPTPVCRLEISRSDDPVPSRQRAGGDVDFALCCCKQFGGLGRCTGEHNAYAKWCSARSLAL